MHLYNACDDNRDEDSVVYILEVKNSIYISIDKVVITLHSLLL